ncbi:MAG: metal-dependent transcriptional regulator [Actinomycetota bacterium]
MIVASEAVQDYLKAIYALSQHAEVVSTSSIADRLGVSPASVTSMIKRLDEQGFVSYRRYQGVALTEQGEALALEVIRHHRLLEAYLHRSLGVPWDKVHDEAEVLEHFISEDLEERIAGALGNPTHDPHGDPIPPKSGSHHELGHHLLAEFPVGPARVERVSDRDAEALRYLWDLGLRPGATITVLEKEPFGGPIWIRVGSRRKAIGLELASGIFVSAPADSQAEPGR